MSIAELPPLALRQVHRELALLRARVRRSVAFEGVALGLLLLVAYAVPTLVLDRWLRIELGYRALLLVTFALTAARLLWCRVLAPLRVPLDETELAKAVERAAPELREALVSCLWFEQMLARGATRADSPALMRAAIGDASQRVATLPFARALDSARRRRTTRTAALAALFFVVWGLLHAASQRCWLQRNVLLAEVDWPRATALAWFGGPVFVVPHGDALTIALDAHGEPPEQALLRLQPTSGEATTAQMSRSDAHRFVMTIDRVLDSAELRVVAGDAAELLGRIQVVARPRIADLSLRVTYPPYMERADDDLPAAQGELRLPAGAVLHLAASSSKPLQAAFCMLEGEPRHDLALGSDGGSFAGFFAPTASGVLTIDLLDRDQLGTGAPLKYTLHVGEDLPPRVDCKLHGISSILTTHARLPGTVLAQDDFGLRELGAELRIEADAATEFVGMDARITEPLPRGALRHETAAVVDLASRNQVADENAAENPIRPGMLLTLRYRAADNFGPTAPHVGYSDAVSFRVVTREKMVEELRRRQLEQRRELQEIIKEHRAWLHNLRDGAMASGSELLARQLQNEARRVLFVGQSYQRILLEYENNRLWEANKIRQAEQLIVTPLGELGARDLPQLLRTLQTPDQAAAVAGGEQAQRRLEQVLTQMEQAETLAALLEDLQLVLQMEQSAMHEVERRVQAAEQELFGPGKDQEQR